MTADALNGRRTTYVAVGVVMAIGVPLGLFLTALTDASVWVLVACAAALAGVSDLGGG